MRTFLNLPSDVRSKIRSLAIYSATDLTFDLDARTIYGLDQHASLARYRRDLAWPTIPQDIQVNLG